MRTFALLAALVIGCQQAPVTGVTNSPAIATADDDYDRGIAWPATNDTALILGGRVVLRRQGDKITAADGRAIEALSKDELIQIIRDLMAPPPPSDSKPLELEPQPSLSRAVDEI